MSHFYVLVIVPGYLKREAVTSRVETMLAPFHEGGEWFRRGSRLDYWMLGGRWTGALSRYDAASDPHNQETCDLCGGTGDRAAHRGEPRESQHASGCNGCKGKGIRAKWPSQWQEHDQDIMRVRDVLKSGVLHERRPFALVLPRGQWMERARMGWWGCTTPGRWTRERWPFAITRVLRKRRPDWAVVVDCHV